MLDQRASGEQSQCQRQRATVIQLHDLQSTCDPLVTRARRCSTARECDSTKAVLTASSILICAYPVAPMVDGRWTPLGLDPIQGNVLATGCSSCSSMRFSQCDTAFSGITSFERRININPISLLYRQLQQTKYKGAHMHTYIPLCIPRTCVCVSPALMKIRFTYTFTKRQLSICPIKEEGKNLIENICLFMPSDTLYFNYVC